MHAEHHCAKCGGGKGGELIFRIQTACVHIHHILGGGGHRSVNVICDRNRFAAFFIEPAQGFNGHRIAAAGGDRYQKRAFCKHRVPPVLIAVAVSAEIEGFLGLRDTAAGSAAFSVFKERTSCHGREIVVAHTGKDHRSDGF